ncbi:MAG TPA: NUDIX hydrolase [Solirubrobacteraceae bacterium]|nr:NUDIX hydrolase [Solirubrobacteraceae bacterium]
MSGATPEPVDGETVFDGEIFTVRRERFRHPDGTVVTREIVRHGGAVGILALDDRHVWLVRQPREAIGSPDLLEIPAGRRDRPGEEPLATAQRELAEEIGRGARHWEELVRYWTGAGFTDEQVLIYLATDLFEQHADSGEDERIEIVPWPLERLEEAIAATRDAKTLIALLELARRRAT